MIFPIKSGFSRVGGREGAVLGVCFVCFGGFFNASMFPEAVLVFYHCGCI